MFSDIYKEIDNAIKNRTVDVPTAPGSATPTMQGTVMSAPGTERIVVSTSIADFMTCSAVGSGPKAKDRCCVVHKNTSVRFNGQYVDSNGNPVSIIPRTVFDTFVSILSSSNKQIQDLKRELDKVTVEKEALKMTINALRKNGVID